MSDSYLRSLSSAVKGLITRGRLLSSALSPHRTIIAATGLAGETFQNIELMLPYGMSALPTGGDLVFAANLGYRSGIMAIICSDSALQIPDLVSGEFGFRDVNGSQVVFRHDRLEVTTPLKVVVNATNEVDVTAPLVKIVGDVQVQGGITATGEITSTLGGTHTLTQHVHSGVASGVSSTAKPTG